MKTNFYSLLNLAFLNISPIPWPALIGRLKDERKVVHLIERAMRKLFETEEEKLPQSPTESCAENAARNMASKDLKPNHKQPQANITLKAS